MRQSQFLSRFGPLVVLGSVIGAATLNAHLVINGIMKARYAPFLFIGITIAVALPVALFGSAYGWGLQEMLSQFNRIRKLPREERKEHSEEFERALEMAMPLPILLSKQLKNKNDKTNAKRKA